MATDAGLLLWCLRGHGRDVRCLRQRTSAGLELRSHTVLPPGDVPARERAVDRLERRGQSLRVRARRRDRDAARRAVPELLGLAVRVDHLDLGAGRGDFLRQEEPRG